MARTGPRARRDRGAAGRRHPGENHRPARYRLMSAAAALPQRPAVDPSEAFEADCPACGRTVEFTQTRTGERIEYAIAEHDCR